MRWKSTGLVVAGAIAVLAAGGWALESWLAAPEPAQGKALIESEFSLVDHTGKPVADEDFEGKWQLVFFGFTSCPDVCPTTLIEVSAILEELGDDAQQVTPLFISVDAERDTPEVMAEYVANFDPRIVGLTGSPEQIKQAAQAFRAYYAKVEQENQPDGYTMDHSAFLYLMDPEGEYATHFSPSDEPVPVAEEIRAYLTEKGTM
jgi:cytochrome oxidase Cu insertion factor (SCO1/SenC/PrrC family)